MNKLSSTKIKKSFPQRSWWPPGPNKDLVKDLTPGPTPVRLGCMCPSAVLDYPEKESITEVVKRIRGKGCTSANSLSTLGTRNKWLDASEDKIAELKEALKKYDVEFVDIVIMYANIIHPDEKIRQASMKFIADNIEAAERMGCRMVTFIPGSRDPQNWLAIHPDNWTIETWNILVESIHQIIRDSSGYKTALGIEGIITTTINSPQAHKRLLEDVDNTRCKVCLDSANMLSITNYYHSTETINESFDLLGENILYCHAKDTLILKNKIPATIELVPPGHGILDFETYLIRMSRLKWPRTFMLEKVSDKEYHPVRSFIEQRAAKVNVKIYN